jgi:hypothetical protein
MGNNYCMVTSEVLWERYKQEKELGHMKRIWMKWVRLNPYIKATAIGILGAASIPVWIVYAELWWDFFDFPYSISTKSQMGDFVPIFNAIIFTCGLLLLSFRDRPVKEK